MPIEIKVEPPCITISQGRTFMITNSAGEIDPQTDESVFAVDTRFISYYHLFINRVLWALINSASTPHVST
jgi:N-terminal domain of (some) glycogen debranching enzymes